MATEALPDEKWFHGQGAGLRVVDEVGDLMTTKTLEQARRDASALTEADYITWLSGHRRVGDTWKFKTRRGEAYILSW